jgi:hypothetical protein
VPAALTNPEPTADRKVRLFICFTPTWIRNRKRKKPETRQAGFGLFWPVPLKTPLSRTAKWMLYVSVMHGGSARPYKQWPCQRFGFGRGAGGKTLL